MSIIALIILLVVLGIVLTLLRPYIDGTIFNIILIIIILAFCLLLLSAFGLFSGHALRLGSLILPWVLR